MQVTLNPNHRFQSITFHGVEITKTAPATIPADAEADALTDPRLVVVTETAEPVKARRKKEAKQ